MMNKKLKLGFSLIELSIVILVIGILVVGVAQGSRIVREAKLKSSYTLTISSPINSISDIVLWLETTSEKSFDANVANGSSVKNWYDLNQTNTKNNATASTGPTYTLDGINGLPVLRFGGSSTHCMNFNGAPLAGTDYSIFVVEQRRASGIQLFMGGTNGANNSALILGFGTATSLNFAQWNNDLSVAVSAYSTPTPRIHSYSFSSVNGKNYYVNGALMTMSSSGSAFSSTTGLTSFVGATIGCFPVNTNYFSGDIAEVVIFNKSLNNTERKSVEQYLGQKWGIRIS